MCILMPQVHKGDCYLLALDLLQQHAATLGAAAIAVTCLMVSSSSLFDHHSIHEHVPHGRQPTLFDHHDVCGCLAHVVMSP